MPGIFFSVFVSLAFGVSVASVVSVSLAHAAEIHKTTFTETAIDGYDPVHYFVADQAAEGAGDFSFRWKDAAWKFISKAHRDLFATEPEKYAPQYGGHCANAMSLNKKIGSDSEVWLIHDHRLFLFYAKKGRKRWTSEGQDINTLIAEADKNWGGLKD